MKNKKLQTVLEHIICIAIGSGIGLLLIWAATYTP